MCHRLDACGRRGGIGRTEIADDLDPVAQTSGQHRPDEAFERRIVTARGVAAAVELGLREGALGERLEDQEARARKARQRVGNRACGVGAIAREACACTDEDLRRHPLTFDGDTREAYSSRQIMGYG